MQGITLITISLILLTDSRPLPGGEALPGAEGKQTGPVLRHSEVVFMYASSPEAYRAYGATFVAWGGANTREAVRRHHDLGIRCTGSVWCLTAGARRLYEDASLREAVAIDIEGKPIAVPWQFDKVYRGQTTDFGNTNHPAFREHVKANVRRVMAGGADGLHVDDHLGVASPALWYGGGFDEYSLAGFREYLNQHASREQLRAAGAADLKTFNYRDLVRKYAATREEVKRRAGKIPLFDLWKRYHLDAAADFVEELRKVAEEAAGHPVLLSANACLGNEAHHHVVPRLTHVVCEVWFNGDQGTKSLGGALKAFEAARRLERPLACTASGHDWAHVKAHGAVEIVRFWIALTYAHGQRFMVPHPSRQWCFNNKLGTHWYQAPVEEFAPVYKFIRENARVLDGYEAVENSGVTAPAGVICKVRRKGSSAAIHVVNRDYSEKEDRMRKATAVRIGIPPPLVKGSATARLLSFGGEPVDLPVKRDGKGPHVILPSLRLWGIVAIGP